MSSFGQRLRRQREQRGLSLSQVAEKTRIRSVYLTALENDDFDLLPGAVFGKGFVKAYADVLGVEPKPLVEAYLEAVRPVTDDAEPEPQQPIADLPPAIDRRDQTPTQPVEQPSPRSPRPVRLVGVVSASLLVLVAVLTYHWLAKAPPTPGDATKADRPGAGLAAPVPTPPGEAARDNREERQAQASTPTVEPPSLPAAPPAEPSRPAPAIQAPAARPTSLTGPDAAGARTTAHGEPQAAAEDPPGRSGLSVPDHGLGSGVSDRQLVGRGTRFEAGSRVWFWNRVVGGKAGDRIRHVWLHRGAPVSSIELKLGGSHWRTQSYKTIPAGLTGVWSVEARDAAGRVIAEESFEVTPAP